MISRGVFLKVLSLLIVTFFLLTPAAGMLGTAGTEDGPGSGTDGTSRSSEGPESRQPFKPTILDSRVEYAIITDEQFVDELTPLAEWKTRKGVAAKIYKTKDIYSETKYSTGSADKAETIHNFLQDLNAKSPYLQWVLLAGDADADTNANDAGAPYVPSRYLHTGGAVNGVNDYYWSDVYFAGLSTDWDNDNDGIFGESDLYHWSGNGGSGTNGDECPRTFDVYVGRLPADTDTEMQTVVEKILKYERDPPNGDWFKTAVFWGGLMDSPNDGTFLPDSENAYEVKHLRSKPLMPAHMTIDEYYDMWSLEGGTYTQAGDNLYRSNAIASVNNGASFINFAGQAYYDGWALLEYSDPAGMGTISGTPYFGFSELYWYTDGAAALNGYMLPLMYLSGCDAAVFNFTTPKKDRSQERMLTNTNGGAIGLISSTAHTYRGEENENSYGNWWLDENFIRLMYKEGNYQPGKALYKLKEKTFTDIEDKAGGNWIRAVRSNTYGYILLGDPELSIWTNIPRALSVEAEDLYIEEGAALVTVKDSFNNQPVEGALVNIMNTELYLQGYTNSTGVAKIPMSPTSTGPVEIIATAHNYYPRELEMAITKKPVDLVVKPEHIWLDITSPGDGDTVQVFARVYNEGGTTLSQTITVRFYQDEIAADSQIGSDLEVSGITSGDYQTVSVMWNAKYKPGGYRIYVRVDPENNLMNEYSKDNNIAYMTVSVKGADLKVENKNLVLKPGTLVGEDQDIELNITIHNVGLVDANNVRIGIYDGYPEISGGNELGTTTGDDIVLPVIYRNSTTTASGTFKLSGGKHDVHVFVDAENATYEVSEGNNIAVKTITVNYAPRLSNLPDITMFEDKYKEKAIDLREQKYVYDHDNLTTDLRFSVVAVEPPGNLTVRIMQNRYVDLIPAENWTTLTPVLVTMGVTDGLSTDTATFNVSVTPEPDPPAITPLGTIQGKAGEPLAFQVSAFDADGDALSFFDDSNIFDIDIYTGKVNFTVNDTHVGTSQVTITVSDGSHDAKMTFTLELRPRDNLPPSLVRVENINAKVGKPFKVLLRATDPDGDSLTFTMDPPLFPITRVSDTTAQLSFTPNANDIMEQQEVFIFVSDGVESDSQKITITIREEKKDDSQPLFGSLNPMLLLLVIAIIIIIILIVFLALRRKTQADRDMQIWESMDGTEREEAHMRTVEELGPLDHEELTRKKSVIEQELLDPAMRGRDKPVIYDAEITGPGAVPGAPPVIAEEEIPDLPGEAEVPLLPEGPEAEAAEKKPAPVRKKKPVKKTVKKMKKKAG